jgi:tRNA threonylcarbamoyladenosine biosynthesis protein TsaE
MSKIINIRSLEEIGTAAQEFVQYISSSDLQSNIFAFFGQMGAGKTTFIKAICKELGVADAVNSPTFTIVNEYRAAKGFPIYHFDFYRINKITEAYDIGIDEYFSGDGLCLIEWPEKIKEILHDDCFQVFVYVDDEGNRTIEIEDNQP